MVIIEDTRQKPGQHDNIAEYCREHGIAVVRSKMAVGDYCSPPPIAIDTKQGMAEVYQDIVTDHERFRKECILAQSMGTRLIILVENDENIRDLDGAAFWRNPRTDEWYSKYAFALASTKHGKPLKAPKPPVDSKRLVRMMETMSERYGVEWVFCGYEDTGQIIERLLYG